MLQVRREIKELYHTRAVVQAVLSTRHPESEDSGHVSEFYEEYKNILMPYLEGEVEKQQDKIVRVLKEETQRGPMVVTRRIFQCLEQEYCLGVRDNDCLSKMWVSLHGASLCYF
jgi:hypothetical protein